MVTIAFSPQVITRGENTSQIRLARNAASSRGAHLAVASSDGIVRVYFLRYRFSLISSGAVQEEQNDLYDSHP